MTESERITIFDEAVGEYVTQDFRRYLIEREFFILPASSHHHGNYEGGLFDHGFEVMKCLAYMTRNLNIHWENERSPYIVGMFHDLCKLENYYWDGQEWRYNDRQILPGHGDKSVMLLSQFMTLTREEVFCIRFHMGPYEAWSREQYGKAIGEYETVLWTHTADMYASKAKGI